LVLSDQQLATILEKIRSASSEKPDQLRKPSDDHLGRDGIDIKQAKPPCGDTTNGQLRQGRTQGKREDSGAIQDRWKIMFFRVAILCFLLTFFAQGFSSTSTGNYGELLQNPPLISLIA
jgi:hypothetical protein